MEPDMFAPRGRLIGRVGIAAAMLCAAAESGPAHAQSATASDIVVLCEPTLGRPMSDIGHLWQRQTGVPVHVITSPTRLLLGQISHHIRSDFIVAEGDDAAAEAERRGLIKPETRFGGWRNRLVITQLGRPAAGSKPNDSSDLNPLLASGSIAMVDAPVSAAGQESRQALETLGLWETAQKQSVGVADTADATYLLTHGQVKLAIVYVTDAAANPEVSIAGTLPDDSYAQASYWVAETNASVSPKADDFETFLRRPEAQQLLRADGLEIRP